MIAYALLLILWLGLGVKVGLFSTHIAVLLWFALYAPVDIGRRQHWAGRALKVLVYVPMLASMGNWFYWTHIVA